MPRPGNLEELYGIAQTGPVLDRINMDIRRKQLERGAVKPQGLAVPQKQSQPKQVSRQSLINSLMSRAKLRPIGGVIMSGQGPTETSIPFADLPPELMRAKAPDGMTWDRFDLADVTDPKERQLLENLFAMNQKRREDALQKKLTEEGIASIPETP